MLGSLRTSILTIFFIFLCIFVFSKVFGPIPFSVNSINTNKSNLFTVSETGEATGVPDTALIGFGVIKQAATVEVAQKQVNEVINRITDDLKKLGVEEKNIKTTGYSVNPDYDYKSGTQKINGYNVAASIEVKLKPVEKANMAIDIATKNGATNVGGVQFVLNDEDQKKLEDEARLEAVKKAKEKAKSLASAAGIKLGRVVDVQETGNTPMPMYGGRGSGDLIQKAEEIPTELNPGENKISITITLSYETY